MSLIKFCYILQTPPLVIAMLISWYWLSSKLDIINITSYHVKRSAWPRFLCFHEIALLGCYITECWTWSHKKNKVRVNNLFLYNLTNHRWRCLSSLFVFSGQLRVLFKRVWQYWQLPSTPTNYILIPIQQQKHQTPPAFTC